MVSQITKEEIHIRFSESYIPAARIEVRVHSGYLLRNEIHGILMRSSMWVCNISQGKRYSRTIWSQSLPRWFVTSVARTTTWPIYYRILKMPFLIESRIYDKFETFKAWIIGMIFHLVCNWFPCTDITHDALRDIAKFVLLLNPDSEIIGRYFLQSVNKAKKIAYDNVSIASKPRFLTVLPLQRNTKSDIVYPVCSSTNVSQGTIFIFFTDCNFLGP